MSKAATRHHADGPNVTRRGLLAHPGSLFTAALALLFAAYIFNAGGLQTWANNAFDNLNHNTQSHDHTVAHDVMSFAPIAAGLIALLILWMVLKAIGHSVKRMEKAVRFSDRESISSQEFVDLAAEHKIHHKVAAHTYRLLLPHYHHDVRALMEDRLREDLHLTNAQVLDAITNLLHLSDKKKNHAANADAIITILDLMEYVEKAPAQFLTHSAVVRREGKADNLVRTAAVGESRMLKPMHKRSGVMNTIKRSSGIRQAAQSPIEPRDPIARPVYPDQAPNAVKRTVRTINE